MLERLEDLPPGVAGVKAVGKVTAEDYAQVFAPLVDAARRDNHRLRLVYELGAEFRGFTPAGMVADTRLTLRSLGIVEACAIITDRRWIGAATRLLRPLTPYPMRVFSERDRHAGIEWLGSLSQDAGVSHHLLADSGVLVIEVHGRLRSRDFQALAITADSWIEMHGALTGIVVHARELPRWADFASMRSHVEFVREHHRKVARIALSTDSRIGRRAPRLMRRFVAARVRSFAYDELQEAIDWAAAAPGARPAKPAGASPSRASSGFAPTLVEDSEHGPGPGEKPAGWPPS